MLTIISNIVTIKQNNQLVIDLLYNIYNIGIYLNGYINKNKSTPSNIIVLYDVDDYIIIL